MTDYRATPEQWAMTEHWDARSTNACLLELRARVEALEAGAALSQPALQKPTLEEVDDLCAKHSFFYEDSKSLEHLQLLITDALARWGSPAKPTPNDRQIRSSLVERVHSCIVGEPECGHMQARAAIREVAAWMREQQDGDLIAADMVEQEAER